MTKPILLLFTLLLVQSVLFSQLSTLQKDKEAVDTLFFSNQKLALEISEKNIPTALLIHDTVLITYFLDQAGELNRMAGNYDRAIEQLHQCLTYKRNWKDLKDLSLTHNNLGKTYGQKGQYELAVFHFYEALKLMETDKNLVGQSFYLNNLAAMYDLQHNYQMAISYYEKSLAIKEKIDDVSGKAASYTNLGISYFNLGDYDKAIAYHTLSYDIYVSLDNSTKLARTLNNLGRTYIEQKNVTISISHLRKAYQMDSLIADEKLRMDIYNNLALAYLEDNSLDSCSFFLTIAKDLASATQSYSMLKNVYGIKSQLAEKQGDLEQALQFLRKSISYNDSLVNEANIYAVADMQGKYEYEKNQRALSEGKLAIAQREKLIEEEKLKVLYWIGLSIVLIIAIVVFLILYFLKQRNAELLKGQIALINAKNNTLKDLNEKINLQLDKTQITLDQKEELLNNVFSSSKDKELPSEILALSRREMEVLSHLALGWSDDQLAEKLFVSKSTVKTHLRRIYSKLLVRGRAEAVAIAHKFDLIGSLSSDVSDD